MRSLEDRIRSGLILADRSKLKALMKDSFEKVDNQREIIHLLLSKLTELAIEKLREEDLGGGKWDYFFNSEDRRKIIDDVIEDNSKIPY